MTQQELELVSYIKDRVKFNDEMCDDECGMLFHTICKCILFNDDVYEKYGHHRSYFCKKFFD